MGKVATSPLPSRGSPPLQSGGKNQKWPTSGQSGYVTPAVSGIPTTAERGGEIRSGPLVGKVATPPLPSQGSPSLQSRWAKSEVAHLWAKWLCHPYRLGDPHHCTAGGGIRSGPLVGKVARSPLPSRGSPPLHSGAAKSEVAHLWAKWLRHPCRLGDPHHCRAGGESEVAHLWAKWLGHPYRLGDPHHCRAEGQNQKWPTCGQSGYATPAVSGIPTTAERGGGGGAKSEVAHKWAKWLRHPCRLGDPHHCGGGGGDQKWPTCGQSGYVTPAVSGIPTSAERGAKSEVAHLWAKWLRHPCRLGDPHHCRAGGEIRSGPKVGKVATSPLPSRGCPQLQSGGQNRKWPTCGQSGYVTPPVSGIPTTAQRGGGDQKWPTCGQSGYVTPTVSGLSTTAERGGGGGKVHKWPTSGQSGYATLAVTGIPTASERGGKSEVAHLWARWLHHPCRLGDPHHCTAGGGNQKWPTCGQSGYVNPAVSRIPTTAERGGKIGSGPQVGKVATSPLPSRGSPALHSGGQNQKWPTCGQSGYVTPAVSGIPTTAERGAKSEVAHKWAKWLRHPYRLGDPQRFKAGGQNRKWPTSGQSGYVTPAVSGIPTTAERGSKSEVAHKWAKWLHHPCRLGDPHHCRAGGKIRSGPQVGKVATSPLPSRGSPPLHSGGGNQKWPTSGQSGYVTPAVSGMPTASERGRKSEVAHLWAKWLRQPCRLGDPHRFKAGGGGGGVRSGPLVGKVATSPLPSRGSPPLHSGGGGSELAHLWAKWLRHPCRLGDPHHLRAGGKIRSRAQKRAELLRNSYFLGVPEKGGIDMAHVGPGQKGL